MDIIIMKMALTEILKFSEIPLKVSFNEYIELSKMYSTPKSKGFVNGVLDKLVEEFVRDNKINKHVKGLSG
jgi:N utilization substance protein B